MGRAKSAECHAQHFLGGGLADTARDAHHTRRRAGTSCRAKRCQPSQRISHAQQLRGIRGTGQRVVHHGE